MVETDPGIIKSVSSNSRLRELESTVEVVDPRSVPDWNAAVSAFPESSAFHTVEWASVLTNSYKYDAAYVVQRRAGILEGVLPVISVHSPCTGRRGVSLPFTDFCPILAKTSGSHDRLFHGAVQYGKQRRWRYLECRSGQRPAANASPSISYLEHAVELANEDVAAKRLRSEVRTAIRKAGNSQVRVSAEHDLESVKCFYKLHCRTRRKHGLPPQPFSFFVNIWAQILEKNLGSVLIATCGDKPVAGAIFFHFNDHVVYKFGASDERFQQLRPNNSIIWEAMRLFYRLGYRVLSLGRSSAGDTGLRQFKCGWGAEEREVAYFRFDLNTSQFIQSRDDAAGWHNIIFSLLPMRLNRLIGYLLYRHMG
jgi:hypothetical protein